MMARARGKTTGSDSSNFIIIDVRIIYIMLNHIKILKLIRDLAAIVWQDAAYSI